MDLSLTEAAGTPAGTAKRTRNTQQRKAVLQAVQALDGRHPTALDVFAQVRAQHPQMSLATVYRALHALVEQGDMCEMRVENVSRFDAGAMPHHHVVCRRCGKVADVHAPLPACLLESFSSSLAESGFTLEMHPVQFTGLCADCHPAPADAA